MKAYKGIQLGEVKFGNDNRRYTADIENNLIYASLKGIKYINDEVKEYLWFLSQEYKFNNYIELYDYLKFKLNKRHIETLIKINYFKDFGTQLKLINWALYSNEVFDKKQYRIAQLSSSPNMLAFVSQFSNRQTEKTIYVDEDGAKQLREKLFEIMPNQEFSIIEKVKHEVELAGEVLTQLPEGVTVGQVGAISYKKPVFLFKSWKNSKEVWINLDNKRDMPKRDNIVLLYNLELRKGKYNKDDVFAQIEVIKE